MRVKDSSFSITSVIFQYQSCDIQAYTRKDICATTWQNQQNGFAPSEDRSAWASAQSESVFAVRMKTGIRPGWSESSLGTHSFCWFCHVGAHFYLTFLDRGFRLKHFNIKVILEEKDTRQKLWWRDFGMESKGTAKEKGWTSNLVGIALKFSGSMLTKETAFLPIRTQLSVWGNPIRTQLSVWGNRCKKSICEPELFLHI